MSAPTLWLFVVMIGVAAAPRSAAEDDDKTLSPYFDVYGSGKERFPLKATKAEVNIAGVIADVVVVQVYTNEGQAPIEANYVFPASTRAAVYGMTMKIGRRVVHAVVQERGQARQTYDKARSEGKRTSLLEQQRPNVFQMHVANIMPGDTVEVELRYTELIIPTDAVYRFVYPTVVGPRYQSGADSDTKNELSSSSSWASTTHLEAGVLPTATFSLFVHIAAGTELHNVRSFTHQFSISRPTPSEADLVLDTSEQYSANRDVVISYQLGGTAISDGLLLYDDGSEQYFLYMAQPPQRVAPRQIPPREYVFIVDVSGSMNGFPLDVSQELIGDLLGGLLPTDRFNIVFFAGASSALSERSLPATKENIKFAKAGLMSYRGGGGTELLPALKRVVELPRADGCSRTVVIATDGYITVEAETFDFIRRNLSSANVFAFGIGKSVNRFLIEGMARAGRGEAFVVMNEKEAHITAQRLRKYIAAPVLTDIQIDFGDFPVSDVVPATCPDVFAERPVVVFGKWKGSKTGTIELKGKSGSGLYTLAQNVKDVRPDKRNSALKYLWAREKIAELGDYASVGRSTALEITELGLRYNLLTAYTSFVAVDNQVANASGETVPVSQPLPLPQGVSNFATSNYTASFSNYSSGGGSMVELCNPLSPASESPRVYVGPLASVVVAYASGADEPSAFGLFEVRDSEAFPQIGISAGVQMEYLLGAIRGSYSSVMVNASFTSLPMRFKKTVSAPIDFANASSPLAEAIYEKNVSLSMLNVDVLYKYLIGRTRLGIVAGPSMGFVLNGSESQMLTLAADAPALFANSEAAAQQGITFSDNLRTATYGERDISGLGRLQFALRIGLLYEMPIRKWLVSPYAFYGLPLTSLRSEPGWKISTLQAGLQLRYALGVF